MYLSVSGSEYRLSDDSVTELHTSVSLLPLYLSFSQCFENELLLLIKSDFYDDDFYDGDF